MISRNSLCVIKSGFKTSAILRTGATSTIKVNTQQSIPLQNVTGLSSDVIRQRNGELGPADSKNEYKVKEYFCYDSTSYYQAEIEMAKFRIPQPSAVSQKPN